jgi:hypothetical protein
VEAYSIGMGVEQHSASSFTFEANISHGVYSRKGLAPEM